MERALRDQDANISFSPADFRRFTPLIEQQRPRIMCAAASPPDADGWCSLSVHAGATVAEIVGLLIDIIPIVGFPCVVAAAPKLAIALGYDTDDVFEQESAG